MFKSEVRLPITITVSWIGENEISYLNEPLVSPMGVISCPLYFSTYIFIHTRHCVIFSCLVSFLLLFPSASVGDNRQHVRELIFYDHPECSLLSSRG